MRLSTVVLALSCLVTGYALVGTRVSALEDVSPARRFPNGIGIGDRVNLWFSSDPKMVTCTIARLDAGWVRCEAKQDPFNKPPEVWYDLAHVVSIEKLERQR